MAKKATIEEMRCALEDADAASQNTSGYIHTVSDLVMHAMALDPSKVRLELIYGALDLIKRLSHDGDAYINSQAVDMGAEYVGELDKHEVRWALRCLDDKRQESVNGK